ncbi:MAG TPA: adenylate/guanylate cyclase domain-containing protein [Candidatus Limnocylindrales bacterium]|nr:adenylate/guanylate cyclase domain-containing protein [Candidatus Limnocylindrales bacterium]
MVSEPLAHTRGFLFADLRGYSAFTERHGDQVARELLARYRDAVRRVIGSFDGAEIRTEGDSFYVVFDSVSQAVRAGLAILVAVAEPSADTTTHPVPVGIGIHAGEAEDSAEGIVSSAVNVAARICAQAQPGELLVSDTVRALTRSYLEVSFLSRGRRRLKGIVEPVALYRVVAGRAAGDADRGGPMRAALSSVYVRRVAFATAAAAAVLAIAIIGGTVMREGVAHEEPTPSDPGSTARGLATPSGSDTTPTATSAPVTPVTILEPPSDDTFGYVPPLELSEGRYEFVALRPRVTFAVDRTGWYAYVDDVDAALLVLDDPSPSPGLHQVAGIAFGSVQVVYNNPCKLADRSVLDATPSAFIEWLQDHELLTASSPRPVSIGGYPGLEVEVSFSGRGCQGATRVDLFPVAETRYGLAAGDRLRVIAVNVPERPLSILVQLAPEADEEVASWVEQVLSSIEIDPS